MNSEVCTMKPSGREIDRLVNEINNILGTDIPSVLSIVERIKQQTNRVAELDAEIDELKEHLGIYQAFSSEQLDEKQILELETRLGGG